ncbi:MAG: DUF4349 domain-containing protein, partial [Xanthomonadaceae bacterium]|nr:DUF4349 domain-containing protein [Xanthomonadaceae bacterium]
MRSNRALIVVGVAALLAVAGCSKNESAEASKSSGGTFSSVDESASAPASAPAAAPPMENVAEDKSMAMRKMDTDGAVASDAFGGAAESAQAEQVAQVETDTRATASQVSSSASTYKDAKRKFIRNAQAQFRVKDVYRSALAIEDVAAAQGGFVVNNNIYAQNLNVQRRPAGDGMLVELTEYTVRGDISVRVPSDNTQAFLRAIANQMDFLDQRSFSAADAQFDILRQQLAFEREQQAQRDLGQASRQNGHMLDKVDVISARSGALEQRDEALIQQKQYEDKVEFSTISLSLYQLSKIRKTELPDVDAIFRDNSPGFFSRLGESLRVGWYGILDVFVALMRAWPVWLALILAVVAFRRWRARRGPPPVPAARPQAPAQATAPADES